MDPVEGLTVRVSVRRRRGTLPPTRRGDALGDTLGRTGEGDRDSVGYVRCACGVRGFLFPCPWCGGLCLW